MSLTYDAISYCVVVLYGLLLILSIVGIRVNRRKKARLIQEGKYIKRKGAVSWQYRFFLFLSFAIIGRIISLIISIIFKQALKLSYATTPEECTLQLIASIPSLLFFSAFTSIAWFFAHMAFYESNTIRKIITPFFTGLNVMLYVAIITIGVSGLTGQVKQSYRLMFDYGNPLYSICDIFLSFCFIWFSCKIPKKVRKETITNNVNYNSQFQNQSQSNIYDSNQFPSQNYNQNQNQNQNLNQNTNLLNSSNMIPQSNYNSNININMSKNAKNQLSLTTDGISSNNINDESQSHNQRLLTDEDDEDEEDDSTTEFPHIAGRIIPLSDDHDRDTNSVYTQKTHNTTSTKHTDHGVGPEFVQPLQQASGKRFFISRLIKLSILCAICWTARGIYMLLIRFDSKLDVLPSSILPDRTWEALFYFILEWPPSIGALFLMLRQPNDNQKYNNKNSIISSQNQQHLSSLSMHQPYPDARENI